MDWQWLLQVGVEYTVTPGSPLLSFTVNTVNNSERSSSDDVVCLPKVISQAQTLSSYRLS